MNSAGVESVRRIGKRAFRIALCVMLVLQTLWIPNTAMAATAFYFRGYGNENVTSNTFQYATIGANVSGTTVTMQESAEEGTAVGLITLDEEDHDISTSIDLGGLEISFSTLTTVDPEGTGGSENDIPSVDISFCSTSDTGSEISSVHLEKPDSTVSGDVTLSSGAHIPSGTRAVFIYLNGTNTTGDNSVVFSNTSFIIRDAAAPSCDVDYNQNWTKENITVTISAADGDSGLEGIYFNDEKVAQTSPYTFVVTENNTSFTAYSMDYAGKQSEVRNVTIGNIDKTTPSAPAEVPLSSSAWSNTDVYVLMPALGESSGAPERYVYQTGSSGWADLPDGFAIEANGYTTIRVAVEDAAGNRSSYAEATARVDKLAPVIGEPTKSVGSGSVCVDVSITDAGQSGIDQFLYAEGELTADYFTTGGNAISGNSFTVDVGGTYTIYASDHAGNTALRTVTLSTAPSLGSIADITMDEDETRNVPLTVSDAESGLEELTISVSSTDDALLQTITVNQSSEAASLDITPAPNQFGGPVTVTVEVEDPTGETSSRQFSVTVSSVNDPPVAQDDADVTLSEDGVVEIDVLANDADTADGDTLTITDAGTPAHGATLIVLGKIRYTPDADFAGTDSFTYEISDGNGGTDTATVTVSVANVNDAPNAADDTAATQEDFTVTIPVLDNDTDVDTDYDPSERIHVVSSSAGAHGTTEVTEDGVLYTPATNFNGTDSFTYIISDEAGLTSEASVTVTVAPQADDPWFSGLSTEYTIDEDAKGYEIAFEIYDVETPEDSLMLQAASLDTDILEQSGIEITGLGDGEADVSLLLSPAANQNGDVDITLTLGDGFTTVERTITIHVLNVNDAPRVTNDTIEYTEDTPYVDILIATLLANDSDIEGDSIFFDGIVTETSVGAIEQINDTTLRYTPAANYDGTDSFTFTVSDGSASAVSTCTLKAIGVNDAPTISVENPTYAADEDTLAVIPFLVDDYESSPADLSVIAATSDDSIVTTDGITIINNGDGTGEVRIQPQSDANGSVTITLTVSDGEAQAQDEVTFTVDPVQDAPVATDDKIYVRYTGSRTFGVLINDHDVDGDSLSVSSFAEELPGTLTFDEETQQFTYRPAIGENGTSTFTYVMTDGTDTASATVTLYVATVTHDPVISAINSQYVNEDSTISGISFNVSDEDVGDTAAVSVSSGNTSLLPNDETHIQITSLGDGNYSLSLTPAADQSGTVIVTVTATDSTERTASTTFALRVLPQNDAPTALDDTYTMDEDGSLALTLLANDTDPDGDTIWLSSVSTPSHGYILPSGSGYVYYPYDNWNGTETLTYRVSDGHASAQASVSITVNPVNDDPVAWPDYCELPDEAGQHATINVLANDYDPDGDTVRTVEIMSAPRHGSAVIETDGRITYTRAEVSGESNGADSFTYRIIDRETDGDDTRSDVTTVYIGEEFISSLYTYGRTVTCYEDAAAFDFDISVSNPNNVEYTLTVNDTTSLGTFDVVDNNTVTFTPAPDQNGYANITYTVEQVGGGEQDTGTIWLHVYPVNDLPVIDSAPTSVTVDEDASEGVTFDVTFHDPDCATGDLYFYAYTQNAETAAPIPFQSWYTVSRTETGASVTLHTAENVNGTGEIVVGVSDGMSYDERTIDLTVTPVDDAPVVNAVSKTIYEDSCVCFASPGSDSEADGDSTVESIAPDDAPQHGTASIRVNHTISYVPEKDFFGTDVFYVTITDQTEAALYSRAMVTIIVEPINDQPEITSLDYYQATLKDTAKNVPMTVVDVDNDLSDSEHYTLTSSDQSIVKDGNISISQVSGDEMQIHIVPEENAYGTVKIDVSVSDGELSAEGAFELNVIPVNDIPIAADDAASVDEVVSTGAESTPPVTRKTIDLLDNDSDVEDGKPKIVLITDVENGTVMNIGGGSVLVSAEGDYNGDVTFTYTVMDRAGATASANVVLTVNPVNDPPRAKDDAITIDEDATPEISVLANDTDPEGDTLTIDSVSTPAHGTADISGTKVLYTPDEDYYGSDSFTYTVSDGNGGTANATVRITIRPVNDAPTIAKHSSNPGDWTMDEDTTKAFHFVVADAESAVSALIIRITSLDESLVKTSQIALTTDAAGYKTITVTPERNAHGTVPVRFQVSDGLLTTTATYDIEIVSVNDAPVVTVPRQTVKEDTLLSASAFATDADGDDVTFFNMTDPAHGAVTVYEDGTFDYMPASDNNGEDSFVIAADDGQTENNIGTATVFITVKPDGDPPVAADDAVTIDEDTPTLILVLENDHDEDAVYGDKISILSITSPAHGTAVKSDGGILYTPAENYNGSDTFQYTISDRDGKLDTAQVSVTIDPVNDAPSGGDDTASVLEDHAVTIDAAANDDIDETTNPDLEDVTITEVDEPAHGTAVIDDGDKTITYTPDANWFSPADEPEVFYYTAEDSSGETARFAISVTVTSVNDLPVITPDDLPNLTTAEDTATSAISFTVSDVETAAGSLRVNVTHNNSALLPTVTVTPDGTGACTFTVTPKDNKVGTATFTVTVTDGDGGTDTDTFTLTVTAVNDLPSAQNDAFSVLETSYRDYNVLGNDDVDILDGNGGDTLTLLSIGQTQHGTATIVNNELHYAPNANLSDTEEYTDTFTYTMRDASGAQSTATVVVTVMPVNDAPTISAIDDVTDIEEDAADGTGEIVFTVTDEEDSDDMLEITVSSDNTTLFPLSNIFVTNPEDDPTGSERTVKAVPAADQFGTGSITLTVEDSEGLTASSTFTVTVLSENDVPDNGNKSYTVVEDVEKQLDVLADIDADYATTPDYIEITGIVSGPSHGTARIATDKKSIYYLTAQDSNEPDSFQYRIHDSYGDADYTFTVSITVTPVNDAPVITYLGDPVYTIFEGTSVSDIPFTVTDVDNVTYAGGEDPVEVTLSAKSSNTILLRNGIHIDTLTGNDRNIDLTPYLKWNGTTTVTITAADLDGLKSTASFVLIVNNINDTPVAEDDTATIPEDQTTAVHVLANDTDADLLTNPETESIRIKTVTSEDPNATIELAADHLSVLVTPDANYNGPVSFTYSIEDAAGAESNTATASITVSQVNDAPEVTDDTATTAEDTAKDIYVLGNDSDVDMNGLFNEHPEDESISVTIGDSGLLTPSHGSIETDGTKITYTPYEDYNGTDAFEYNCYDGDVKVTATV
ncbi:MAG: tandem-95 repeat protein, partial [Clostridiales bacterium]|nr:tandem-95 repeat protein [Clostridiales bacterium]